jgi:hypothetical protein
VIGAAAVPARAGTAVTLTRVPTRRVTHLTFTGVSASSRLQVAASSEPVCARPREAWKARTRAAVVGP